MLNQHANPMPVFLATCFYCLNHPTLYQTSPRNTCLYPLMSSNAALLRDISNHSLTISGESFSFIFQLKMSWWLLSYLILGIFTFGSSIILCSLSLLFTLPLVANITQRVPSNYLIGMEKMFLTVNKWIQILSSTYLKLWSLKP